MNLLTLIVILYLLLMVFRGYRRGFIKTLFSLIFLFLVVITTTLMYSNTQALLEGSEYVSEFVQEQSEIFVQEQLQSNESFEAFALAIVGSTLQVNGLMTIAAEQISGFIMTVLAIVITTILAAIFWIIVEVIINSVVKRGFIGPVNRALGALLGLLHGLISVWIFFGIAYAFQFVEPGNSLVQQVEASPILNGINSINILMRYMPDLLMSIFGI